MSGLSCGVDTAISEGRTTGLLKIAEQMARLDICKRLVLSGDPEAYSLLLAAGSLLLKETRYLEMVSQVPVYLEHPSHLRRDAAMQLLCTAPYCA